MRSLDDILANPKLRKKHGFDHTSTNILLRIPRDDRTLELIDLLVRRNTRLVYSVAKQLWKKFSNRVGCVIDYEDVIAAGMQGLMIGINRFDARYGNEFSTYAVHWIKQTALREIENNMGIARIPVHFQERLRRESATLKPKNGSLADLVVHQLLHPVSLDAPVGEDLDLIHFIPSYYSFNQPRLEASELPEAQVLKEDLRRRIEESFALMKAPKSRDILRMRFGLNDNDESHTLEEVGERYNLTRERVRQIAQKYFEKVKKLRIFDEDELAVFRRVS